LGTGTLTAGAGAVNVTVGNATVNSLKLNGSNFGGTGNMTINALTVTNSTQAFGKIARTGYTTIGTVALSDNATAKTLYVGTTNSGSGEITGVISNGAASSGSFVKEGTGTWVLSGANTFNGTTSVGTSGGQSGGILQMAGSGKIGSGAIQVFAGTLDINGTSQTATGVQLGGGGSGTTSAITLGAAGNLTLSGTTTFSATNNQTGATISGGTLNEAGSGTRDFSVGDSTAATVDLTVSSVIADGGATGLTLRKNGAGVLVFSGANTYNATTLVSVGVLNIQNATALGSTANGTSVVSGAALQIQGGITVGAEALTLNGAGISTDGALRNISGSNTYGGNITLGSATRINSDSGTLTLNGAASIGGATFGLTVGGSGNTTISTAISTGNGTLTKDGSGTLTLSVANTYTGTTTVSAGTLLINGSTSSSSAVTVSSGAKLGGGGTISGTVSVSGTVGAGNSIGTLSTGNLTLTSTGILDNELGRSGTTPVSDLVVVTGSVTLDNNLQLTLYGGLDNPASNDIFFLINNDGSDAISGFFTKLNNVTTPLTDGSQFTWNFQDWKISYTADYGTSSFTGGNDLAIQVVPEPTTWALLAFSLTTVMVLRRRRNS
jgi:autotransporter-associated beta strand protein